MPDPRVSFEITNKQTRELEKRGYGWPKDTQTLKTHMLGKRTISMKQSDYKNFPSWKIGKEEMPGYKQLSTIEDEIDDEPLGILSLYTPDKEPTAKIDNTITDRSVGNISTIEAIEKSKPPHEIHTSKPLQTEKKQYYAITDDLLKELEDSFPETTRLAKRGEYGLKRLELSDEEYENITTTWEKSLAPYNDTRRALRNGGYLLKPGDREKLETEWKKTASQHIERFGPIEVVTNLGPIQKQRVDIVLGYTTDHQTITKDQQEPPEEMETLFTFIDTVDQIPQTEPEDKSTGKTDNFAKRAFYYFMPTTKKEALISGTLWGGAFTVSLLSRLYIF